MWTSRSPLVPLRGLRTSLLPWKDWALLRAMRRYCVSAASSIKRTANMTLRRLRRRCGSDGRPRLARYLNSSKAWRGPLAHQGRPRPQRGGAPGSTRPGQEARPARWSSLATLGRGSSRQRFESSHANCKRSVKPSINGEQENARPHSPRPTHAAPSTSAGPSPQPVEKCQHDQDASAPEHVINELHWPILEAREYASPTAVVRGGFSAILDRVARA
jgi:hypothetical protein